MSGELGRLLQQHLEPHLATHRTQPHERAILRAMARCGTGEYGWTEHGCTACGDVQIVPRGCGNRHCPRCQGRLARAWLERQQRDLLPCPYFHAVFTLPHALLPLCVARPALLYGLLFDAAAQTLLRLGREQLGGLIGATMILHTWGQRLNLHPHVHAIVTGGALSADHHWRAVRLRRYLFAVRVMSAIFRGKFLSGLTTLKRRGELPEPPGGWPKLWRTLGSSAWVVYCKAPFAGPEQVLAYLSNYTHRVAISERRLEVIDPAAGTVTFRWRDYADHGAVKRCTVTIDEFLRRFRRHLLPRGFTKIRHYGLLANNTRVRLIQRARLAITPVAHTDAAAAPRATIATTAAPARAEPRCRCCGQTAVYLIATVTPNGRRFERGLPAALACTRPRPPPCGPP